MKLGIDPGHGGKDPGAVANGIKEKDITLAVTLRLADRVLNLGWSVVLTRYGDRTRGLQWRSDLFNREKVDLAISLHCNAAPGGNPAPAYVSTYYYPGSAAGGRLAREILVALVRALGWKSGGANEKNFHMVRETKMPACLVEMGFVTNPSQAEALARAEIQEKIALAIREGIEFYAGAKSR